jgi:hypothetical protein
MAKNKDKKTRGQMAEARRMSGQAGVILSFEKYANPGVGYVFPKSGRDLTVTNPRSKPKQKPKRKK